MSGRSSRVKGATYERRLANLLREWLEQNGNVPADGVRRGIGQARFSHEVPDVKEFYPFWIEAKKHRQCSPRAALKQAFDALTAHRKLYPESEYTIPIAITCNDRDIDMVSLSLQDFLEVLSWHGRMS